MAKRYIDLTGERFGRLLVLRIGHITEDGQHRVYWLCQCDCGSVKEIRKDGLISGAVKSCGCYGIERRTESSAAKCTTHGMTKNHKIPSEYRSWYGMKTRCLNPSNPKYPYYGGRGIKICERWKNSFESFYADMGSCPPKMSIDRIDVNGNYEPGNCRWADAKTQRNNRRDSVINSRE